MRTLDTIALILLIIGGLNWGLVGAFQFDLVATLFGEGSALSRLVYVLAKRERRPLPRLRAHDAAGPRAPPRSRRSSAPVARIPRAGANPARSSSSPPSPSSSSS